MNKIQTQYLNRLLRVPKTTPKCALIKENELMKIEHIANQRKLEYNIDLNNREDWRLEVKARKIQEEKKLKYYNEIEELKVFYNIKENLNEVDPKTAKNTIKKAVLRKNEEEVNEAIKNGKKTENIKSDKENYINKLKFEDARILFMAKAGMLDLRANYKNKYKDGLECKTCVGKVENTQHIFECPAYEEVFKKLKGTNSLSEIMKRNRPEEVADSIKEIMKLREEKESQQMKHIAAPQPSGSSRLDSRV